MHQASQCHKDPQQVHNIGELLSQDTDNNTIPYMVLSSMVRLKGAKQRGIY